MHKREISEEIIAGVFAVYWILGYRFLAMLTSRRQCFASNASFSGNAKYLSVPIGGIRGLSSIELKINALWKSVEKYLLGKPEFEES